ncbi:uroporphyrinogen-III synthase [Rhodococcus sp. IEGM 1408]|uniref:uroporphyrinogen-III synthase n=1 Tax=Rhodococcus sp. IEGM 1408 TaxID=3082220 RepID=UPI002955B711|nr:uroporphyrinogen-III synthase [Rhodococcus sp. IEGM 1408]MDV8001031.1 uroporphyrinogen-III synthase [Rhodococcus sp. IEGM 1408]
MPGVDPPLRGRTVAVTAARRASEQRTLLERRGATVLHAPAIHMIPVAEDSLVREATERTLAAPADLMVLTTASGVRWWMQVCEEWGLAEGLLALMGRIPLYSRGPKVTGALRAAGLREHASSKSEASPELLEMLLERGVEGLTVCVQVQGSGSGWNPVRPLLDGLRAAGAEVVEVPVYRWELPENLDALDELVRTIARQGVDGVTFTAAPAVVAVLERARALGVHEALLDALRGPVAALCVGPVTAAPLAELDVPFTSPDRMRLGALMRHTTEELVARTAPIEVAGHELTVCAAAVLVDGEPVEVTPAQLALLRALSRRPGACVSREDLLAALPGDGTDSHAVETAMGRLRRSLAVPDLVTTVVKRGYRLNV